MAEARHSASVETPIGRLGIQVRDGAVVGLDWASDAPEAQDGVLKAAADQLAAYFAGDLREFDLPLAPGGSAFDRAVGWEMVKIPYGQTRSYGEIAKALGAMAQPVGQACGANTIPIIIPCHRVVSATGTGGFSGWGGVETKAWLLRHEGALLL